MTVLRSIHTNKRLKYLCPSVERIQPSADNKQASLVWCIPTLPTVAAPQWASSPAHNRGRTKPRICRACCVTRSQSYCRHSKSRCVRWGHNDHIWGHAAIIFMGEDENGANKWQRSAFMPHSFLSALTPTSIPWAPHVRQV